jgi:hypothetical protein
MDGPQFHVDIPKVEEAANGIAASVDDQHEQALTGQVVAVVMADDSGGLRVDLEGGARLLVPADPNYEAWTVAGPNGLKVVSLPGGGLSVWSPQT